MAVKSITIGGFGTFNYDDADYPNAIDTDGGLVAVAPMPAADILASLLTVDGTGSGLDADLLEGQHGTYYAVSSPKAKFTAEGGFAISLTNKTGALSVKGTVVECSLTTDNAFDVIPADHPDPIGVVYEDGVADGSECWIVIQGRAQVLLEDSTASTRDYWCKVSDTVDGRVDATNASPPGGTITAINDHFTEVGHSLESKVAGTDILCFLILHFN